MRAALQAHAARGLPIYAKCGGLMYLCEWLEDQHGQRYPQVGLIPGGTRMTTRLQQFGYAEATFMQDTLLGPANTTVRGHRFHYSVYEPGAMPLPCAYRITRATTGETHYEGFWRDHVLDVPPRASGQSATHRAVLCRLLPASAPGIKCRCILTSRAK